KEHAPERYGDTVAKVLASGKTPAGSHRSIMVAEVLEALAPKPGELAVDCTLGYGGHARALLERLQPGGRLIGLDVDPLELPKTENRLRELGFGPETFLVRRRNFAGLPQVLAEFGADVRADVILADLGVSSMQLDDPARGFSVKHDGPLGLRMNPQRGQPAADWLARTPPGDLVSLLEANDEPAAAILGSALAGKRFATTRELAAAIREALVGSRPEAAELAVRRVFQAVRIAVNDEFSALETFLRHLPSCLNAGGRVAILTFHSGEDRRVKKAFEAGLRDGAYAEIARDVIRPTPEERRDN